MTQQELRDKYNERLVREKQTYISEVTGIAGSTLSRFRNDKINLPKHLFEKLEEYLLNNL